MKLYLPLFLFVLAVFSSCTDDAKITDTPTQKSAHSSLFELKTAQQTGIDFNNTIVQNDSLNYLLVESTIVGAGVGVVDVNNDGLQDVFFSGNMVSDRLYLNKGNLQFEDITKSAGLENDYWSTAVAFADVNGDGWQDIYVGRFIYQNPNKRRNALYINNGDNTFTDKAADYGIDHQAHCTAVNFFDYDKDGDLDLYLGTQPFVTAEKKKAPSLDLDIDTYTNRLFRNDGAKFTEVTKEAGLSTINYCLSATVADVNHDGWPDMYVTSDYEEPDYYYVNNQDGTFTDQIHTAMRHISNFSMGSDIADINNDGYMDIMVADMAPEDNYRSKANMSGMNPKKFWNLANNGYHHQYMFNTLQLNNGNGLYSEIGHMAGIAKTDWSWATLLADYDLDGDKDLYITNGYLHDARNKDYLTKIKKELADLGANVSVSEKAKKIKELATKAPQEPLANYLFMNDGSLSFHNQAEKQGMGQKTFSQGAAYADLDNDGDLDILVNNINERAFLFENHASQQGNHYLSVKLNGAQKANAMAYGAKVWLFYGDNEYQLQEVSPVRGYMSSSDPVLNFGLGSRTSVDRLVVEWPNKTFTELKDVKTNQRLVLNELEGGTQRPSLFKSYPPLFKSITAKSNIPFVHEEQAYDDYKDEVLIPHRMSRLGPAAASADVNGDGLDDAFLGGGAGQSARLYLQQANSSFAEAPYTQAWAKDMASEDVHAHFFDVDNDGDQDLYVSSGSNEFAQGSPQLQDRLYINDGKGQFSKSNALPQMHVSTGVAASGDMDGDGDLDLFVGGRQVPNQYGHLAPSFILRNNNGKFEDASDIADANMEALGMVTDAHWADLDGDKDQDLVLAGEWMPVTVWMNENGELKDQTQAKGLAKTNGWWNRLAVQDIDGDGDQDIVAGNLGLNIKFKASEDKPFLAYVKDFDENGTNDVYLGYYDVDGNLFPVRGRQCSSEQMPYIIDEFENYDLFAKASLEEVLGDRIQGAIKKEAFEFKSMYFLNQGDASFKGHALPNEAQAFPVNGIVVKDLDSDGRKDLLLAGNYYEREVETTRSDAGVGLTLLADTKGGFYAIPAYETGLKAYFDVRNLLWLNNKSKPLTMVVNNSVGVQLYEYQPVK